MTQLFNFCGKSLVVITGASRGIGRTIAVETAKKLQNDSTIILIARSADGLKATKDQMMVINKTANVTIHPMDLQEPNLKEFEGIFNAEKYENAVIFHNAGSLGTLDKTTSYTDLNAWNTFFTLNLFSASLLNSAFINALRPHAKHLYVVNISSLCGSQAFKNLGMYGSGKAARNLFFKTLAAEDQDILVLNYSPGPVDTDMVSTIIDTIKDDDIRNTFTGLKEQKTILTSEMTVNKLLGLLESGHYKSGDLIDYFDRI